MRKQLKKLIINFTPTGMIPTKDMTPYVPITPSEIIKDVLKCAKLGINIVHLHARGNDGKPTYKKEVYEKIIVGIREKNSDLILGVSCSGRSWPEFEKRSEVLDLKGNAKPDMASLTLSSLNFNKIASVNSPIIIKKLAEKMLKRGIKPELEVFDLGMINYAKYLIKKRLLEPPYYFNIILGNIACAQADPMHAGLMLNDLPDNSFATFGGVGGFQHDTNILGLLFADGVRIGLEDYIYYDQERKELATNEKLVERVVRYIRLLGRKTAKPREIRKLLKLDE